MDGSKFDALVSSWTRAPRRHILRLLTAGLAASVIISRDRQDASAKCVKIGGRCRKRNGDKNQTKAKKCCGGAKCDQKKCHCPHGKATTCSTVCCTFGQVCSPQDTCVNGANQVGDFCTVFQFKACASGVCGCESGTDSCTCREAECLPPGGDCSVGGTGECCQGVCTPDVVDVCSSD